LFTIKYNSGTRHCQYLKTKIGQIRPYRSAVARTRNISGGRHPEGQIIWRPVPQDVPQEVPQELFKQSVVRLNFSKPLFVKFCR